MDKSGVAAALYPDETIEERRKDLNPETDAPLCFSFKLRDRLADLSSGRAARGTASRDDYGEIIL